MGVWWSKLVNVLSFGLGHRRAVRQALQTACECRAKAALELPSGKAMHVTTSIEQVRDEDIIIAQPLVDGQVYPLAFGERVCLAFNIGSVFYTGYCHCLGRTKIPTQRPPDATILESMIFAYRLSLPAWLETMDHRVSPRVRLYESPIEAHLYSPAETGTVVPGRIIDMNMTGAKLSVAVMQTQWLAQGKAVFFKATLPEPVGFIDELVDVARMEEPGRGQEYQNIGIRFRRRIEGLEEFIRANQPDSGSEQLRKSA